MDKTIQFVSEAVRDKYKVKESEAYQIVTNSFFPEVLKDMPDYVHHYDAEYWADEIMKDNELSDIHENV